MLITIMKMNENKLNAELSMYADMGGREKETGNRPASPPN